MKRFHYHALDTSNASQRGQVEAHSRDEAVQQLQARGWMILKISAMPALALSGRGKRTLKTVDLLNITRHLATLIMADQPLERALNTLIRQQKSTANRALLERVLVSVKDGRSFSQALEAESGQFSPLYLAMVRAGEASGALNITLKQLSDYLEESHKLRTEFINALIYPAFLLAGVLGSVFLLLTFVIPQFVPVFDDLNVEIPLITRVILAIGQWSNQYGIYLLLVLSAVIAVLPAWLRKADHRERFDRWLLSLPRCGELLAQAETARISRTLGTLLHNGVALLPALKIVQRVSRNRAIADQLQNAHERIKSGQRFSDALDKPRLLPDLAIEMIGVGEASGQLDQLLLQTATIFDDETRHGMARFMAAFTPVLTLLMAVLVMGIMLAVMLPLMSLTNNI